MIVVDTRTGLGTGRLPAAVGAEVTQQEAPAPEGLAPVGTAAQSGKRIILIALIAVALLMAVVIAVAIILRRKRLQRD